MGVLRRLGLVGAGICLLWLGGLVWFATPPADESSAAPTDAIVVLTGGSLRLQSGIDLLREGKGQKLFVSGVNQQVDLDDLLRALGNVPDWALCCIVIGHKADNTFGNAQETAHWVRSQGFRSLRLVTAWYHMPRSLLEFDRALPETDIVAHPVFPDRVMREHWWTQRGTAVLLVTEYVKFLAALSRPLLEWRKSTVAGPSEAERAEARL
ncbi:MAG: YdcF family protein [Alphaproteobacteria bacterium]|nr:YdcF family protein [Alphaproteobacteria bacterium]MBV9199607.1 YdcF family protein [Alphaproteobacteria bacterium]MBV9378195.1 YdcF family protein [Alphaproteobacteria bacterium]